MEAATDAAHSAGGIAETGMDWQVDMERAS
jgi:hypothetical protein